jgi:CheY-specific phosphatase CheX
MQTEHMELLSGVFCEVLEKMAFMFGERVEKEDLPQIAAEYVQVKMTFTGPLRGGLALAVPSDMRAEFAANVLGMEPDDEFVEKRASDALKEVLNVTCGHMLTTLVGEEPVFDLSIPTLSSINKVECSALLSEPETLCFLVDDHPVLLRLLVEGKES